MNKTKILFDLIWFANSKKNSQRKMWQMNLIYP